MDKKQGTLKIVWHGARVCLGEESLTVFMMNLSVLFISDLLLTKEVLEMDLLICYPETMLLPMIFVITVMAIAGPVLCAVFMKNEGKGKFQDWEPKYIATMIIAMLLSPSLGLIAMSFVAQRIDSMNDVLYLVLLPVVMLIVAYLSLRLMNEGIKSVVEQIKRVKGELEDAKKELKN